MSWRARLTVIALLASTAVAVSAVPAAASGTFNPVQDTYVDSSSPTSKFGSQPYLKVDNSPILNGYLRFTVQGVGPTTSAVLRLYAESASSTGLDVHTVADTSWTEGQVTYNNAPTIGAIIHSTGSFSAGGWLSVDVSSVVKG